MWLQFCDNLVEKAEGYCTVWVVYLSLDHVLTVQTEVKHTAVQVDGSFRVQLLQNPIQGDKCSCAPDTSTEHTVREKLHLSSRLMYNSIWINPVIWISVIFNFVIIIVIQ